MTKKLGRNKKGLRHKSRAEQKRMSFPNSKPIIWNNAEVTEFLIAAELEGEGMMCEFELLTGLRLAELLALSWSDIHFEQATVTVSRIVAHTGKEKKLINGIRSGGRKIRLPLFLIENLKKHQAEQQLMKEQLGSNYNNELGIVFPKKDGSIQNPLVVKRKFQQIIENANLSRITFHDLRRIHASLLIEGGVSPAVVSERLGYQSIETAIEILGFSIFRKR